MHAGEGTTKRTGSDFRRFLSNPVMTTKIKLILGGIILLLGIVFAVQNAPMVEVKLLVWSIQMSQALVIFLTGAAGIIVGFFFGTAFKISRQP